MTRYYHGRFFEDTRFTTVAVMLLFVVGFWAVPEAFLLIPVVTLLGANQTAFDASYLYFARHYAAVLEEEVNSAMRRRVLVGADLEDRYLFRLNTRKVVGIGIGSDFSWFGWMTVLYTTLGIVSYGTGLALGWSVLAQAGSAWSIFYAVALGTVTLGSIAVGGWWFVAGTGETRIREVLDARFGKPATRDNVTRITR